MFTGFASENTPAIQVWDFFNLFATSATSIRSVSLPDDCAPIQVFRTGASTLTNLRVNLPTAPIEGKQITIVNQNYGLNTASINIYSSDRSGDGSSSSLFTMGAADSIVLVYSKQNITYGTSAGVAQTGWIALNRSSPTAANAYSAIVGGNSNIISSTYSFIGGGTSNTASGLYSAVIGGSGSAASGQHSFAGGGSSNAPSGSGSGILGGINNLASAQYAVVAGGNSNIANSGGCATIGGSYGTSRAINGNYVTPASNGPIGVVNGVQQRATLLLARQTTDATATRLTSNQSAAGTTNQVILPNNSAYTFQGTCIANVTGGDTSGWKFEGVIERGATAASTALIAAVTPTVIAQDAGASTWVLAITADTTNGGIAVTVTGQAATTIRWVVQIETTEVTY